jgi:arsenate reductase
MAEGFARHYGSDAMVPASAGLNPATNVARDTIRAMEDKGIIIREHFPKSVKHLGRVSFDLIINMSGHGIPASQTGRAEVRSWDVDDPVFMSYEEHCEIRDQIERLVVTLVLELRREQKVPKLQGQGSGPIPIR